jgi:hypothetical protein
MKGTAIASNRDGYIAVGVFLCIFLASVGRILIFEASERQGMYVLSTNLIEL